MLRPHMRSINRFPSLVGADLHGSVTVCLRFLSEAITSATTLDAIDSGSVIPLSICCLIAMATRSEISDVASFTESGISAWASARARLKIRIRSSICIESSRSAISHNAAWRPENAPHCKCGALASWENAGQGSERISPQRAIVACRDKMRGARRLRHYGSGCFPDQKTSQCPLWVKSSH